MEYRFSIPRSFRVTGAVAITLVMCSSVVTADLTDAAQGSTASSGDIQSPRGVFDGGNRLDVRCKGENLQTDWENIVFAGAPVQRVIRSRCVLYQQGEPVNKVIL